MAEPTLLDVQTIELTGLEDDMTENINKTNGNWFANDGRVFVYIKNAHATDAITVTVDSVTPCNYGEDHDISVSVPAGKSKMIGRFDPGRFNNASGRVKITYSGNPAEEDVTIGVFRM